MKHELFAACAGVVAVMAPGLPGTAAAAPPELVPQGKINSIVLSKDDVSSIVGATLDNQTAFSTPAVPGTGLDKPECSVLFGLDTDAIGDDFDVFKRVELKDGDSSGFDHLVVQDVATYGDADTPATLFRDTFQSVSKCTGTLHASNADWQLKAAPTVTNNQARWSMSQLADGQPFGWRCAYDVRMQNNVMLDAVVCQYGNPTRTVKLVADRMTSTFSA